MHILKHPITVHYLKEAEGRAFMEKRKPGSIKPDSPFVAAGFPRLEDTPWGPGVGIDIVVNRDIEPSVLQKPVTVHELAEAGGYLRIVSRFGRFPFPDEENLDHYRAITLEYSCARRGGILDLHHSFVTELPQHEEDYLFRNVCYQVGKRGGSLKFEYLLPFYLGISYLT